MSSTGVPIRVESVVIGLGLIGLGVVLTLGNLERLDALHTLRTWWPLLLVVWGGLEIAGWGARRAALRRSR
jgi:hypothetical protein